MRNSADRILDALSSRTEPAPSAFAPEMAAQVCHRIAAALATELTTLSQETLELGLVLLDDNASVAETQVFRRRCPDSEQQRNLLLVDSRRAASDPAGRAETAEIIATAALFEVTRFIDRAQTLLPPLARLGGEPVLVSAYRYVRFVADSCCVPVRAYFPAECRALLTRCRTICEQERDQLHTRHVPAADPAEFSPLTAGFCLANIAALVAVADSFAASYTGKAAENGAHLTEVLLDDAHTPLEISREILGPEDPLLEDATGPLATTVVGLLSAYLVETKHRRVYARLFGRAESRLGAAEMDRAHQCLLAGSGARNDIDAGQLAILHRNARRGGLFGIFG